jgi:CheY-like chemotaxis protein
MANGDAARRILVVEDDPDLRQMAAELLRMIGHEPHCAEDAETALRLLASEDFDWLFTDISLPGMDGLELAKLAKQMQTDMRIVFASGYGNAICVEDRDAVVLKKPYHLLELQRIFQA